MQRLFRPPAAGRGARRLALPAVLAASLAPLQERAPEPETLVRGARVVVHVRIQGELDVGTRGQIQRAIRDAKERGADLLLEIDTPGGKLELMWQLASQVAGAPDEGVTAVAWVHDHALSAGALLAMAAGRIYMTPQAIIGAAAPVSLTPEGTIGAIPDETMREKVTSAVRTSFRAFAESRGRPPALAEAMVDADVGVKEVTVEGERRWITQSEYDDLRMSGADFQLERTIVERGRLLSLSGTQAVELGMADGLASSLGEVLEKMGASNAELATLEREPSDDLAAFLHRIRWLLLIAGLVAAYTEIKAPGFGLPGIVAVLCFGLFLFGHYLVGLADVPHIVAVAAGLALVAVEVFVVPGTLWLGLAGAALVIGGLALAVMGSGIDYPLDRVYALDTLFALALWSAVAIVVCLGLSRFLPHAPLLGRLVLAPAGGHTGEGVRESIGLAEKRALLGAEGRALTDLRPVGKIALASPPAARPGEELEARAAGAAIDRGARVRVVEVSSGRLVVEAVAEELAPEPGQGARA